MAKIKSNKDLVQSHAADLNLTVSIATQVTAGSTNLTAVKDMVATNKSVGKSLIKLKSTSEDLGKKLNKVADGLARRDKDVSKIWNQK